MQIQHVGGVGDFGKFALLRHIMQGRRLAVCWYVAGVNDGAKVDEKHFNYLRRPNEFRHLAPDVFDQLAEYVDGRRACLVADPLAALQTRGVLESAVFVREEVPQKVSLRPLWINGLVNSVIGADLVFLDPDNGIQGQRLTSRHVALAEIAALRSTGRVLIIGHHQSGRKAEVKYLADRMKSIGCDLVEIVRLRLVTSCLYVMLDQDTVTSELTATFVRKWGNLAKSYRFDF
jgi:hypothetical protein